VATTRRYKPIRLGSPGEDISKKDLHAVSQRFKNLHQLRLHRAQDFLQPRQRVFLHLLPLLFHQNHPLLPGFISSDTPAGIPDYTPNKQTIHEAKQFSKGFRYKRRALLNYSIPGIFLMGSVSSIAFSKASDMDIWLCYNPDLSAPDLVELQQKATAIEKWATTYHLEVHFFLVNNKAFCKGHDIPMSAESSGTTQHYLLLEEFYRTAIFIAGQSLAWWLVPPEQEQNYSSYLNHLIENRFISEDEYIDFGGLESIPAEEFISATLWHIYKSINSPHKSLLKLFLMESYASEYPKPKWLCFDLKKAIYRGSIDVDRLDPYLLIYSKVENYLQKANSTHRLNLARQCFYFKIMGSSKKHLDYHSRQFRSDYLQSIADKWNWPEDLLPALAQLQSWNIKKATQEHIVIRSQLKHCLRMVVNLAGTYANYNYRDNPDLKLISRKLHVFLEQKPGKIEIITTRANVHIKEDELSIFEKNDKNTAAKWTLFSGTLSDEEPSEMATIKHEHSLLNLLSWLVINGLYHKQLKINFISTSLKLSNVDIHQILDQLFKFLSNNLKPDASSLDIYSKPDKLISSLIFINLGHELANERDDGMLVISERSDPLSYGKNRLCFIQKIDQISVSNWGEVTTSQHQGLDDFFSCLTYFFNNSKLPITSHRLTIACYTPARAKSIIIRTQSIIASLVKYFSKHSNAKNIRYILPGEHSYYVFQQKNKLLHFWPMDSNEQLFQELANTQDSFSDVYFDPQVLDNSVIPFIYKINKPQAIQVFYLAINDVITLFIVDEKGALFIQEHQKSTTNQLLSNYSLFLTSILNYPFYSSDISIEFYEIQKNSAGVLSHHLAKWTPSQKYLDMPLRITIEDNSEKNQIPSYYIYCNDIEFSTKMYGDNLFEQISNYILDCRKNDDHYPVHITDIDVPCSYLGVKNNSQLQMIYFLNYKKKIESKLVTTQRIIF
jgi:adenylate cyclase class 1